MARLLFIDDDATLLDVLALAAEDAGYVALRAADGRDGLARIRDERPDVVVSDINMPRLDGFALCRKLRETGDRTPLILLTSRDSDIDEALGLELGADDYVSKPFSTRVLMARVASLLRRDELSRSGAAAAPPLCRGKLTLDGERLAAAYDGRAIDLTVTEFKLLEALARRAGVVLSRPRLLELVRDDDSVVADRIVDAYVRRLRRKLEAIDPAFDEIETLIGAGYRWREPSASS